MLASVKGSYFSFVFGTKYYRNGSYKLFGCVAGREHASAAICEQLNAHGSTRPVVQHGRLCMRDVSCLQRSL